MENLDLKLKQECEKYEMAIKNKFYKEATEHEKEILRIMRLKTDIEFQKQLIKFKN